MPIDPYASCPCGSGKKFKWCCQPIHVAIDRAFQQDAEGQHELALRLMDEVLAEHPGNPEGWGRKAQLLFQNDRVEDAESALQKAFEINPNYPFGHLLRGMFRYHEGETAGALVLFRKAADCYDPEARDLLAQVYALIAEAELKLNHPVACRAALRITLHCQPNQPELRQHLDEAFGPQSRLPASARQEYRFQSPAAPVAGDRRPAWDRALSTAASPRLSDAARAFDALTQQDPEDAAAWYNLALARAWLGDNAGALPALDRYVALEPDEGRAGAAWALAEVLRLGHEMMEQADYVEHSVLYQVRDPRRFVAFLQDWDRSGKLGAVQVAEQQGIISAVVMDTGPVLTAVPAVGQTTRLGAYLMLAGDLLRLWHPSRESLERARLEVQQSLGPAISEPQFRTHNATFGDTVIDALAIVIAPAASEEEARRRIAEHAQRYFEETWIHRPLKSLNRIAPIDVAGSAGLRKKLRGVIQFLEECAAPGPLAGYDFNSLRQKLGLLEPAGAPAAAAADGADGLDFGSMSAADLAGLKAEALSDEQLGQAWQAAQQLDAQEVAGNLARALVARPVRSNQPDRFPWYSFLVQRAVAAGDTEAALNYVNEGERVDGEANEGRRRNEYEQRRAQLHAKRGEADQAYDAFVRLIERAPSELKYRGSAIEAMLGLRQGQRALKLAEEALARARQQNDRDSERYFLELVAAARKQVG